MARNRKREKRSSKRKRKVHLVFDENKRKEFLTGFHKRKLQRKKQAQERLESQLKEERKRLKKEVKESYKKLVVSNRPVVLLEKLSAEEYADDQVTVKITQLTAEDIAKKCNTIGTNSVRELDDDKSSTQRVKKEREPEIEGMELSRKKKLTGKPITSDENKFSSTKEVKKTLRKMATRNVKNSMVFQKKNKMEGREQKKKALQKMKEYIRNKNKMQKKGRKK